MHQQVSRQSTSTWFDNACSWVAHSMCTKTLEELLTGMKPNVGLLHIFGCKVWAHVFDRTCRLLEAKAGSGVQLLCLSYGNSRIILENDHTVDGTRHFSVGDDLFHMKQWQEVSQVSSSKLEESLLNDCNEDAVDIIADGHELLVLDWTGEGVVREEAYGCVELIESNPCHKESEVNGEDSVEEIEESHPPPRVSFDLEGHLHGF